MPAKILLPTASNLSLVAEALRAGKVAAMPTETVYGLAGNAFDPGALAQIFAVKERPTFDPLICHVPPPTDNEAWTTHLVAQGLLAAEGLSPLAQQYVERLARAYWPGPLTLVLPKGPRVPDLATSGLPTVGIRAPRHVVAQALLREVGVPLAAPSANRFGRISPTMAAHVAAELGERIEFILDGGACEIGVESTVLLVEPDGGLRLLRPGAVSASDIAMATDAEVQAASAAAGESATPLPSPGLLASHYAPQKPLSLLSRPLSEHTPAELAALAQEQRIGVMVASGDPEVLRARFPENAGVTIYALSRAGDLAEAARQLFATLRACDDAPEVAAIWAETMPGETGLAHAINDRLRKASHR